MTKERIGWIDTAKAIGIVLMIAGHCIGVFDEQYGIEQSWTVNRMICSFHMPFFFFLSGLTLRAPGKGQAGAFAGRKAKELLIPAFCLTAAYYAADVLKALAGGAECALSVLREEAEGFFFQCQSVPESLWFLPALFLASAMAGLFMRASGDGIAADAAYLPLSLILYEAAVCSGLPAYFLPFNFSAAVLGSFFLMLGHICGKAGLPERLSSAKEGTALALSALALIPWAFASALPGRELSMHSTAAGDLPAVLGTALLGILGFCLLSRACDSAPLQKLGRITVPVLFVQKKFVIRGLATAFARLPFAVPAAPAFLLFFALASAASVFFASVLSSTADDAGLGLVFGRRRRPVADAWARPSVAK